MWKSRDDVAQIAERLDREGSHRMRGLALVLASWVNMVDSNSDGWGYWKPATNAANKLADILGRATGVSCERAHFEAYHFRDQRWEPTEAEADAAIRPMKAFATKRGLPSPLACLERLAAASAPEPVQPEPKPIRMTKRVRRAQLQPSLWEAVA